MISIDKVDFRKLAKLQHVLLRIHQFWTLNGPLSQKVNEFSHLARSLNIHRLSQGELTG